MLVPRRARPPGAGGVYCCLCCRRSRRQQKSLVEGRALSGVRRGLLRATWRAVSAAWQRSRPPPRSRRPDSHSPSRLRLSPPVHSRARTPSGCGRRLFLCVMLLPRPPLHCRPCAAAIRRRAIGRRAEEPSGEASRREREAGVWMPCFGAQTKLWRCQIRSRRQPQKALAGVGSRRAARRDKEPHAAQQAPLAWAAQQIPSRAPRLPSGECYWRRRSPQSSGYAIFGSTTA
mmetsp:Transcript_28466/g.63069  ORF Transcript_28466/g.63069 Transcript_28466/m.63069 type:complete len:231 (+) Transcript_28466:723-1415(+)